MIRTDLRSLVHTTLLLCTIAVHGQAYVMTDGSATGCSGTLYDSGGELLIGYSNNEDLIFTLCPDEVGNYIAISFPTFDMDESGPAPIDRLAIYDGPDTTAVLLGTFSGSMLQGVFVAGTIYNATGCLTLHFLSNSSGTGSFIAEVSCIGPPCASPTAVATMNDISPAHLCLGDTLVFDGSTSFAEPGLAIASYTWMFENMVIDDSSGMLATHVFNEPGLHSVHLQVTDEDGCTSTNAVPLHVLVEPSITLQGLADPVLACPGVPVVLTGSAAYADYPPVNSAHLGEGLFLPDDLLHAYSSDILITQYGDGAVITDSTEIVSICARLEHSSLTDFELKLTCPNGQSIRLHEQGGGFIDLGDAFGYGYPDTLQGSCWDYCWSPVATAGTMAQAGYDQDYQTQAGTPLTTALIPGTYRSKEAFAGLVGCPLNGIWRFTCADHFGLDSGFLCDWSIDLATEGAMDTLLVMPSFGPGCDSSYWTSPWIVDASMDCDTASLLLPGPGSYYPTYSVVDDFGCTSAVQVAVQAVGLEVFTGNDTIVCPGEYLLAGTMDVQLDSCTWSVTLYDEGFDSWSGAMVQITTPEGTYTFSINWNQQDSMTYWFPMAAGWPIDVFFVEGAEDFQISYEIRDGAENIVFNDGPEPQAGLAWSGTGNCPLPSATTWSWSPADLIADESSPATMSVVETNTWFVGTVQMAATPFCVSSDSVFFSVLPSAWAGTDSMVSLCPDDAPLQLLSCLGGFPDADGTWTDANWSVVPDLFDPATDEPDTYYYVVYTAFGCADTASVQVVVLDSTDASCNTDGQNEFADTQTRLFPQPAGDVLFVASNALIEGYSLYGADGRLIRVQAFARTHTLVIPLEGLDPGSYILLLSDPSGLTSHRFLKGN